MNGANIAKPEDLAFDRQNLYQEETFTDLRVGSIRRLTPVTPEGTRDMGRPQLFTGQAQLMSPAGPLPIQCNIDATSLDEAMTKFPVAINEAVEKLVKEAEEIRRQEASRIVVPGQEAVSKLNIR